MSEIWLSPTQIDTYRMCKRKWAWGYIAGIKSPPNRFAKLGLDVHDVLEEFLKNGTAPDRNTQAGKIAIPGLKFLPSPGQAIVEGKFVWELPEHGFNLTGRIDWREMVPAFGDHKTTSDFKWMKTVEVLETDVQAIIYAAYILYVMNANNVRGRWVYYRTKRTPASKKVDFEFSREHVDAQMVGILETGREMVAWKRGTREATDLPYDAKACDAYGGCFYREKHCNLTSKERLVSLMAQESLKDKLARKKAEAQAQNKPQPQINPPENAQASEPKLPPEQQGLSLKEKLAARKEGEEATAAAPAAPEGGSLKDKLAARKAAQGADAAAHHEAPPAAGQAPPPVTNQAPPPAAQGSLQDKMKARKAAAAAAPPTQAIASPPVEAPAATADVSNSHPFEVLFVDCGPVKSPAYKLIPLAELLEHRVEDKTLAQVIDDAAWPAGTCVSMSLKTPLGQEVFEVLSGRASLVVRGF